MMITVKPSPALYLALQKRLNELGKGDYAKEVMRKAIRETAKVTKEALHSETKALYTIKGSALKKSDIKVTNPTKNRLRAMLEVEGKPLSLKASYRNRKNGKRKGASAMIKAGGKMQELKIESGGHTYKAFVATITNVSKDGETSEHVGIFQRVPGKRMKKNPRKEAIKQIYAPAKSKAAEGAYRERVDADVKTELSYRLHKHINAMMGG